jgi:hypothetical protein
MTPTSFAFTLTMPGDERFVGAIRLLAAQAASYAQLSADAGEALAGQVQHATEAAIVAAGASGTPLEFAFSGDAARVTVEIGCTLPRPAAAPVASGADGVSVRWKAEGPRLTCTIQRPTAA